MKYEIGDYIVADGIKRYIRIEGKVTEVILGGYQVEDETTGLIYHVRHADFVISQIKNKRSDINDK